MYKLWYTGANLVHFASIDVTKWTRTSNTENLFILRPHQVHQRYLLQHMFENRWQQFEFFGRCLFGFVRQSIFLGCLLHFFNYTHNQVIIVIDYVNILGRNMVCWVGSVLTDCIYYTLFSKVLNCLSFCLPPPPLPGHPLSGQPYANNLWKPWN